MANLLKGINNEVITSQSEDENYKDCGKSIHDYKFTRLPRGDEQSHEEFVATKYKRPSKRGMGKQQTEEEIAQEQQRLLRKKESDAMKATIDVEQNWE